MASSNKSSGMKDGTIKKINPCSKINILKIILVFLILALFVTPSWANELLENTKETGIELIGCPIEDFSKETLLAGSTTPGDFFRYPPMLKNWKTMVNKEAYFRDVMVGQKTHIYNAVDGDEWSCKAILPDGSTIQWGTVRFYSSYDSKSDCFVSSSWYICGSKNVTIFWYTSASQCGPTGDWTFEQYYNGSRISFDNFKLLPQIPLSDPPDSVPLHSQRDYPDKYDHTSSTISAVGCALTSAVMVLGYHGINTTPRDLNNYLKSTPGGYDKEGNLRFDIAVQKFSGNKVKYAGNKRKIGWLEWIRDIDGKLEKEICGKGPQIMRVKGRSHFVVGIGRDMDRTTWHIADSVGGVNTTLTRWGNEYESTRMFVGPEYTFYDPWCRLNIRFHSPGELVITDPLGRKEGYDPVSDVLYYDEIADSGYDTIGLYNADTDESGPETKEIEIWRPIEGEYELKVTGTGTGTYDLEFYASDREGGPSIEDFSQVSISPNVIHSYIFNYSREAGSKIDICGAFDGKGQRPRDVNKFLSYSNPTRVTTEIPAGEMTFDLFIFYDLPVIPSTFEAVLNGQDITNLFSPVADKNEVVKLTLAKGRNVLILSVDGTLASERVATDKDRLVFIVP